MAWLIDWRAGHSASALGDFHAYSYRCSFGRSDPVHGDGLGGLLVTLGQQSILRHLDLGRTGQEPAPGEQGRTRCRPLSLRDFQREDPGRLRGRHRCSRDERSNSRRRAACDECVGPPGEVTAPTTGGPPLDGGAAEPAGLRVPPARTRSSLKARASRELPQQRQWTPWTSTAPWSAVNRGYRRVCLGPQNLGVRLFACPGDMAVGANERGTHGGPGGARVGPMGSVRDEVEG